MVDLDFSECPKLYLIRNKKSGKYCGFRLSDNQKAYPYKNYGAAKNYIITHGTPNSYEIDVFVGIHRGLPEERKGMYK